MYIVMWMWRSDVDMVDAVDGLVGYMCCVLGNTCGVFLWTEICVVFGFIKRVQCRRAAQPQI